MEHDMILSKSIRVLVFTAAATVLATSAFAPIDARMFSQPSVSREQIAFVYAGALRLVSKKGGVAVRLTSSPGEESFPRFSPDGSKVAYSASYHGKIDVYVVPSAGGGPRGSGS